MHLLSDFHPKGPVAEMYDAYIPEAGIATRATYVIDKDGKVGLQGDQQPRRDARPGHDLDALAACPV